MSSRLLNIHLPKTYEYEKQSRKEAKEAKETKQLEIFFFNALSLFFIY